jgi:hypothetical protein
MTSTGTAYPDMPWEPKGSIPGSRQLLRSPPTQRPSHPYTAAGSWRIAVGVAAYGAGLPRDWAALLIRLIVRAETFCSLGLAATALIPKFDAAPP